VAASERVDPDTLLGLVVDLIRDQFELYHTQVYVVEPPLTSPLVEGKGPHAAVLRQSTGYAGAVLLQRGHQIPLEATSLVTRAILTGEAVLVSDTGADPDFMPNPLLPETKSEMVMPLKVGEQVIGVLDAQDITPGRFTESTVALFQVMAGQIAFLFENSELLERVTDQTKGLTVFTNQLRTVAEIARQAGTILDTEKLLQQVVDLMQSRFNLYYAHIYVLDAATNNLVVRAGSGAVGEVLVEEGHAIPLDREKSLVARAARSREPVLIEDTSREAGFMPNPFLPQTRSELAVPLQDEHAGRFTENDVDTYATLAGQIATALQNASLFEAQKQAEAAIAQSEVQQRAILETTPVGMILGYTEATVRGHVVPNFYYHEADAWATMELLQAQGGVLENREIYARDANGKPLWLSLSIQPLQYGEQAASLVAFSDITVRKQAEERVLVFQMMAETSNEAIVMLTPEGNEVTYANPAAQELYGVVEMVGHLGAELWREKDLPYLAETVLPQAMSTGWQGDVFQKRLDDGMAFEAAATAFVIRDESETPTHLVVMARDITERVAADAERERFATQLAAAAEVSAQITTILDRDELLNTVIALVKERFGLYHVHFYALDTDTENLVLRAGYGRVGQVMKQQGHTIPLHREHSVVARAARAQYTVVVNDVFHEQGYLPNMLLPDTRAEVALPVMLGTEVLGVLDAQADRVDAFTEADLDVLRTLVGQIGSAFQNARTFEQQRRAELEVRQSSETIRAMFDAITDAVTVSNMMGETNEATLQLYGYESQEQLLGHSNLELVVPAQRDLVAGSFTEALSAGNSTVREFTMLRYDGSTFAGEAVAALLRDELGNPSGFVTVGRDITERKRAEAERERFTTQLRTAAEVSSQVNTILDPQELLEIVVPLIANRFGLYHVHVYTYDEETEMLVMRVGSGEAGKIMRERAHMIPLNREQSLVARAAREKRPLLVNDVRAEPGFMSNPLLPDTRAELAVPLIVGEQVLGILDVQADEVNRFSSGDQDVLTTLAGQIAAAFQTAISYERIIEVDRLKGEFLANMSHELRTPLNSILGYTEVMLMGIDGELTQEMEEDVRAIFENGGQLLRLINDILDLTKIEAGRMTLTMELVDVIPVLEDCKVNNLGLLHKRKNDVKIVIDVEEEDLPFITADRVRMAQILNNLVSNAVKFTEKGFIYLRARMVDAERMLVQVEDTGMGMSKEDQSKIFQRFRQVDGSSTRRAEGTGLGLAITRSLVEMHGWTMELDSETGQGSRFNIYIPVDPEAKFDIDM